MRALVQRVERAEVRVDGTVSGSIGRGLLVLLGVGKADVRSDAEYLARKVGNLRIFPDEEGRMSRDCRDAGGAVLVVSQFTLYANCRKGNRPSFDDAGPPDLARELYEMFVEALRSHGLRTETGQFQAMMQVELVNDGPVTIWLQSKDDRGTD